MRAIAKQGTPMALQNWVRDMRRDAPQNLSYGNLPTTVKDEVKKALLAEQGHLCAYTLRRLHGIEDCHIEHVEPQNAAPGKDLDYANMAACVPKDGGDTSFGYGAPIKAGKAVTLNADFVSPHMPGCGTRFRFDAQGGVQAATTGDAAAQETITTLKLDHGALTDLRRAALQAHGLTVTARTTRTARQLKSAAEARRFAAEVLQPGGNGQLEPFCAALAQVALAYAEREDARSQRLRGQRTSNT